VWSKLNATAFTVIIMDIGDFQLLFKGINKLTETQGSDSRNYCNSVKQLSNSSNKSLSSQQWILEEWFLFTKTIQPEEFFLVDRQPWGQGCFEEGCIGRILDKDKFVRVWDKELVREVIS